MKQNNRKQKNRFRFLALRAIVTTVMVLALLLGLRLGGVIKVEPDAPVSVVEEKDTQTAVTCTGQMDLTVLAVSDLFNS